MGSVPIHMPKLFGVSCLVEFLGILAMLFVEFDYNWLFLFAGIIYFFIMFTRYRNNDARHKHELETKKKIDNLRKVDQLVKRRTGLTNSKIEGANNTRVSGEGFGAQMLNQLNEQIPVTNIINSINKNN